MKKIGLLFCAFSVIVSLFILPKSVFASEKHKAEKIEISDVYNFFMENGVEEKKAKELINRIQNGELLDSMNPNFIGNKTVVNILNGEKTIYPDGSIKISTVNMPEPIELISPFSAGGGSWQSGSSWWIWKGVEIKETTGGASIYFKMDCSGNAYDYSSITKVYDGKASSVFDADYDDPVISRAKQTSTSPAIATFTCDVTFLNLAKARIIVQGCVEGSKVYSRLR